MTDIDFKGIFAQVKANSEAIRACKKHRFERQESYSLGQKHKCIECGGEMRMPEIGSYIRGYEAHGGNAEDIFPGWNANTTQIEDQPTKENL